MAGRRMFARAVTGTGQFMLLPSDIRCLYYELGMNADDDGFAEGWLVLRMTGREEADLRVLEQAGYVKVYGRHLITYIVDWDTNNQIRKDRYRESRYAYLLNEEPQKEETPQKAVSSKEEAPGQAEPRETAGVASREPAPEGTGPRDAEETGAGKPEHGEKAPQEAASPEEEAELVRRAEQRVTEFREKRRREKEALREARLREGAYYVDVDRLMDGA